MSLPSLFVAVTARKPVRESLRKPCPGGVSPLLLAVLLGVLGVLGSAGLAGCGEPGRALGQFARLEIDCQLGLQVDPGLQRQRYVEISKNLEKAIANLETLKKNPNPPPGAIDKAERAIQQLSQEFDDLFTPAINAQNMDRLIRVGTDDKGRQPLFRCEFRNQAKVAAQSCVKIKVTPPNAPAGKRGPVGVVSETVCSGLLLPDTDADGVTDTQDRCPNHGSAHPGGGAFDVDREGCIQPAVRAETSPMRCAAGKTQTGRCATEVFLGGVPKGFETLAPMNRCFQGDAQGNGAYMCVSARNFIIASCFDDQGNFTCNLQVDEIPL